MAEDQTGGYPLKKALHLLLALFLTALLSSCVQSLDALFQLPVSKPEYQQLQSEINKRLSLGWEMAYPTTGELRTTMHFADLTGDGAEEAVILLRSTNSSDLSMLAYADNGEAYALLCEYGLTGSAFSRISFDDVNGDGSAEILLGIQHGTEALYTVNLIDISADGTCESLLKSAYTDWYFYDANSDGVDDLLILQNSESSYDATAILYSSTENGMQELGRAPLSVGVTKPEKIVSGKIDETHTVAVVESKYYVDGYIADTLLYRGEHLVNLGYDDERNINTNYLMPFLIAASDCDGDGLIELPQPEEVSLPDGSSFYRIDWYAPSVTGTSSYDYSTYHDLDAGWYIRYPESWRHAVRVNVVTGSNGVRRTTFLTQSGLTLMELRMYPARRSELIPANTETILFTISGNYITAVNPVSDHPSALSIQEIRRLFYIVEDAIQFSAVPEDN